MLIPLVHSAHIPAPTTPGFQPCLYFPHFSHISPRVFPKEQTHDLSIRTQLIRLHVASSDSSAQSEEGR